MDELYNPKISIITVCLNSEKHIRYTIESVLQQQYSNIEYIIIDGQSVDNTVAIIKEYQSKYSEIIRLISEKDDGIYDAMNKGVSESSGEIIYFLNSADYLLNGKVISEVVKSIDAYKIDILFGNAKILVDRKRKNNIGSSFKLIFRTACHQALFAKRSCFLNNQFNLEYRWLADYDWLISCFSRLELRHKYFDIDICYFDPHNNTSYGNFTLAKMRLLERKKIGLNNFKGFLKILFMLNQWRLLLKLYVKYIFSNWVLKCFYLQ